MLSLLLCPIWKFVREVSQTRTSPSDDSSSLFNICIISNRLDIGAFCREARPVLAALSAPLSSSLSFPPPPTVLPADYKSFGPADRLANPPQAWWVPRLLVTKRRGKTQMKTPPLRSLIYALPQQPTRQPTTQPTLNPTLSSSIYEYCDVRKPDGTPSNWLCDNNNNYNT